MIFFGTLATLAVGLTPALAASAGQLVRCATTQSEKQMKLAEASFISKKKASKASQLDFSVVIPVYWHVIQAGESLKEGHIPVSHINDSLHVLNSDYKSAGFSFSLVGRTYTTNATWFNLAGPDRTNDELVYQTDMKQALRQGNESALNIYSTGLTNVTDQGLLGYATFPHSYQAEPLDDGVVFRYSTVPGGSSAPFDMGKTLTHEVGHWLGLYHTFEGGCDGDGDMVFDTPAQFNQTEGCPSNPPDTCPDQPGRDPIHNFMDYSYDICLLEFTPGQIERMREQFVVYRSGSAY